MRIPDEVWLPALAKTAAEGTSVTEVVVADLREYNRTPPAREFTFSEWPAAPLWLEANYPAWRECATAIQAVTAGLADDEYIGVAMWLAMTRYPDDRVQQQRVIAGFLLGRASTVTAGGWQEQYIDSRALLRAISEVLDEHLSPLPPAPRRRAKQVRQNAQPESHV